MMAQHAFDRRTKRFMAAQRFVPLTLWELERRQRAVHLTIAAACWCGGMVAGAVLMAVCG